ncbi:hypothetical protein TVAG_044770 [Trichomonas vaginalis G3]|uniref:DUF4455 domain-containing protein n=1 Tax=Trichomonas vaginalis (strain ATCC PRA-98 / G3) TaxID=412133 RepID=A2E8C5_TRIV3|nr:coiled-coil domain-containing protein 180 family [Trichomonas vaginalis G3]EAY11053.1 hypothetical protein TVAG_044770 [Trichomonas vaginalis G3]KAI5520525.1 coiled-coil domain-containing protein 180 family [Trichomonas vaginalis G3]|eukprot:XP_001323276.1 hypothetical protein [Trichomonas vaginalis G3]
MSLLSVSKNRADEPQGSSGVLARYQERLASKYSQIVKKLQDKANSQSSECRMQMANKMMLYRQAESEILTNQKAICDSLGTTQEHYDVLKEKLQKLSDELLEKSRNLKTDCMELYDNTFKSLHPLVEECFNESQDIIPQMPVAYADKLPRCVSTLNVNYLRNKQELIKTFFTIELGVMRQNASLMDEFQHRTDEWKANRFNSLVADAKNKFNPNNTIDLMPFYENFHQEQGRFTLCCKKLLQNISLVAPPAQFSMDDLNKWWAEVEDILSLHAEFIKQFTAKLQAKVDEVNNENAEYLQKLEQELVTLKEETESSAAIAEITPLLRASQKYNATVVEKLTKYWENRKVALRKSFESIKEFVTPLINDYAEYTTKLNTFKQNYETEQKTVDEQSTQLLDGYEQTLTQKTNEITTLVDAQKIKQCVDDCKQTLSKIEAEYREHYKKVLAIIEKQPGELVSIYESSETNMLTKLKMKKTANSTEFDEATALNTSASTRQKSNSRAPRRTPKAKESKTTALNVFSFSLENGAKFEEIESIAVIPPIDEYTDEPEVSAHGKGKGKAPPKKPAKPPPRPKKPGQKGKGDEFEEVEAPEFSVTETLPKVDGNIIVYVYTPFNTDIIDWINQFRRIIITDINSIYSNQMRSVSDTQVKQDLVDQLNERLRTHAPRANAIELNIAQARTLQIESRKVQLEKHFRHAVAQFNQSNTNIEGLIARKKTALEKECEKLDTYVNDLNNEKSSTNFSVLGQNLHISERQFNASLEATRQDLMKEIDNLQKFTNDSNERFIKNIVGDEGCPQEETDMANEYFGRMKEQVDIVIGKMRENANGQLDQINQRCQEILQNFDSLMPIHQADVSFIEQLNSMEMEAKSKFETLLARNKSRESEIDFAIQKATEAQAYVSGEPQQVMLKQFESLDNIRVLMAKRGNYLSLLTSNVSTEPIGYTIDLGDEGGDKVAPMESPTAKGSDSKGKRPKSKKSERDSKPKEAPKKQDVKAKATDKVDKTEDKTESTLSFSQHLQNIGQDFTAAVNKSSTDYYNTLKGRKIGITRTEQIPPAQQELVDNMQQRWTKLIESSQSVTEQSVLRFRSQVINASTVARSAAKVIFDCFEKYYDQMVVTARSDVQQKFEVDMKQLQAERTKNKQNLTPALADPNNSEQFAQLINQEQDRTAKESKTIMEFQGGVLSAEKHVAQLFMTHIPVVSQMCLQLFDGFILTDDLKQGAAPGAKRKTMKELLKEKMRQEGNGPVDQTRNVKIRQWPALPAQMSPLNPQTPTEGTGTAEKSERSGSRKKKRPAKTEKTVAAEPSNDKESGVVLSSLDTVLHHGAIVERNRCFDEYEEKLKKRIDEFQEYTKSLINDMNAFTAHWKLCVQKIKPNNSFFETQNV